MFFCFRLMHRNMLTREYWFQTLCDCLTVGVPRLIPVHSPTPAHVSAHSNFNDVHLTTSRTPVAKAPSAPTTTQKPAMRPQVTVGQTSQSLTRMTTANERTTMSVETPPPGPGDSYAPNKSLI